MRIDIKHVLPILQGLLASGHYTQPPDPDFKINNDNQPELIYEDNGEEFEEFSTCRYEPKAISEAIYLTDLLTRQLRLNNKLEEDFKDQG